MKEAIQTLNFQLITFEPTTKFNEGEMRVQRLTNKPLLIKILIGFYCWLKRANQFFSELQELLSPYPQHISMRSRRRVGPGPKLVPLAAIDPR